MAQVQVPSTATSSIDFQTIFTTALEAYKQQTRTDISSHPLAAQLQSCDSPTAILAVLQAQVQAFDQSQSKEWTKWLDPIVNVLYASSATIGTGVGLIFAPSNVVFSGIGILLQAVKDVRASQDALGDIFGRMEYFFKRLEAYIEIRPTVAMIDIVVKIMVEVLSILGIVTKEIRQGKMKKYLVKLVGRKDVEDALQRLDKLTQEEARMAAVEALTISRGIDDKVKDVDEKVEGVDWRVQSIDIKVEGIDDKVRCVDRKVQDVDHKVGSVNRGVKENGIAIQQVVNQFNSLNRNELRKDLRKWVAPPDPSINYNAASSTHHEGTTAWCTKGDTLTNWKTSGSLLWIHGKPGSGKSILSSVIIQHIKTISASGSASMAYFFFDFKDKGKQDSRALLSSLLIQLSNQSAQFCEVLLGLFSAHEDGSEQPTNDSLAQCLKDMLMIAGQMPIYLIMDALDECPNDSGIPTPRETVLGLVKELVELRRPNLRICITSRPEFDIYTVFGPLATQQLSLHDERGQKQDIIDYITSVVHTDRKMKSWRDDDKDAVIEKLTQKAEGMFRWVFCQLEVLRHCVPTNILRILEQLPKSLDETYERILKAINDTNREQAYRLLQYLTVAIRPLRVEELAELLATDPNVGGIPKLNANWRWEDQEAVLSACAGLVSVIIENGSRVVQFSHSSVKDFLTSSRLASSPQDVSRFHIPFEASHVILSQACLGVLLRLDDRTDKDSVEKIPLDRYAAQYWYRHAQVGDVESQIKDAIDYFFDTEKPHFSAWARIQGLSTRPRVSKSENSRTLPPLPTPLYLAAEYGLHGLAERLIVKYPRHVNGWGGICGTPLHASALSGNLKVAQLLVAHGANINPRSAGSWTPLHHASRGGHLNVGKWLLKLGADVNSPMKDGWTSLHFAAARGHLEVCRMLLERNAEVNCRNDDGSTPLLCASSRENPDAIRLLLDHSADPHVLDKSGKNPLHIAAFDGHLDVARLLLERNVKVNARDNYDSTPLFMASSNGHPDFVRLLLYHNADVHVRGKEGLTALHYAAANGHCHVVLILLERNAEVNSRDFHGSTPLLLASEHGHSEVVRILLDHKANAYVRDDDGDTALHCAALASQPEVARILLNLGAEVNSQNDEGSSPLHLASEGRKEVRAAVVQLLLDHGADVDMRNNKGKTPLYFAAIKGYLEVARILLECNAEVDSRDYHGSTPFLLASECGHPDVVQLLLDHNADAYVRDGDGDTSLHCAALAGQLEVARVLLGLNAEIDSQNDEGSTPLHLASEGRKEGSADVVLLLLDHGADAHIRNNKGKTASEVARGPERHKIVQLLSRTPRDERPRRLTCRPVNSP